MSSSVIHADETVVQVLKKDGKSAASESRMWVYASSERGGKPVRYFEYKPSRSGKHAAAFLKGFTGCLVTDGYAGYNHAEGVVRCGCWAHMRRKWREAMPKGATKANSKAAIGVHLRRPLRHGFSPLPLRLGWYSKYRTGLPLGNLYFPADEFFSYFLLSTPKLLPDKSISAVQIDAVSGQARYLRCRCRAPRLRVVPHNDR